MSMGYETVETKVASCSCGHVHRQGLGRISENTFKGSGYMVFRLFLVGFGGCLLILNLHLLFNPIQRLALVAIMPKLFNQARSLQFAKFQLHVEVRNHPLRQEA